MSKKKKESASVDSTPQSEEGSLSNKIKKCIDALEKSCSEFPSSAIKVEDLSLAYNHMWTPAAKLGMAKEVKSLAPTRKLEVISTLNDKAIDKVHFFSVYAVKEKIVKAARMITDDINKLAAKGYVTGCLKPLSAIALAHEPHEVPKYAVFCFVSLTKEGGDYLNQYEWPTHQKDESDSAKIVLT